MSAAFNAASPPAAIQVAGSAASTTAAVVIPRERGFRAARWMTRRINCWRRGGRRWASIPDRETKTPPGGGRPLGDGRSRRGGRSVVGKSSDLDVADVLGLLLFFLLGGGRLGGQHPHLAFEPHQFGVGLGGGGADLQLVDLVLETAARQLEAGIRLRLELADAAGRPVERLIGPVERDAGERLVQLLLDLRLLPARHQRQPLRRLLPDLLLHLLDGFLDGVRGGLRLLQLLLERADGGIVVSLLD